MKNRSARFLALTPLAALVLALPAMAQTAAGTSAPNQLGQEDRGFIQGAASGGTAEIDFARLADQKSRDDAMKRFAQRMIQDHTKANDQLAALAKADGVTAPTTMDAEHRATRARLEKLSGARFDRAYIEGQVTDHQQAAQLFQHEADSGQDGQLKSFAAQTLPVIRDHLKMARGLEAEMTPQAQAPAGGTAQSGSSMSPASEEDGAAALNRKELQSLEGAQSR